MNYTWKDKVAKISKAGSSVSFSPTTSRYYTLISTGASCKDSDSVFVKVNPLPKISIGKDTSVCTGDSVSKSEINKLASTNWYYNNSLIQTGGYKIKFKPSANGYLRSEVTFKSTTGCSSKDSIKVSLITLPIVKTGGNQSVCLNSSVVIGDNAIKKYGYVWTAKSSGSVISTVSKTTVKPLFSQSYTLKVYDSATTCSNLDSARITVNTLPIANAGKDTSVCFGGAITLSTTSVSGVNYTWKDKVAKISKAGSSVSFSPTTSRYYTLISTGASCKDSDSVFVKVNQLPKANAGKDTSVCFKSIAHLSTPVVAGTSYQWKSFGGIVLSNYDTFSFRVQKDTSILLISSNKTTGCKSTDTVKVFKLNLPVIKPIKDSSICQNESINETNIHKASEKSTWSNSGGLLSKGSTFNYIPLFTDNYYLSLKDTNSSCTNTDTFKVIVNKLPVKHNVQDSSICYGGIYKKIIGIPSGNIFQWTPKGGTVNNNDTIRLNIIHDSIIFLFEKNLSTGCKNYDTFLIHNLSLPIVKVGKNINVCAGQTIFAGDSAIKHYGYKWTSKDTSFTSNASGFYFSTGLTKTLKLKVVDSVTSCVNTDSIKISVYPLFAVNTGTSTPICLGDSIKLGLSPVTGNSYSWSSIPFGFSSTSSSFYVNPKINTTFVLRQKVNSTGCLRSDTIVVKVNGLPILFAGKDTSICQRDSIKLGINLNNIGYNYSWSLDTSKSFTIGNIVKILPKTSSIYIAKAIDKLTGCKNQDTVLVKVNPLPIVLITGDDSVCSGISFMERSKNIYSGNRWYLDNVLTSIKDSFITSVISSKSYKISLYQTTINGCVDSNTKFLKVNSLPKLTILGDTTSCYGIQKWYSLKGSYITINNLRIKGGNIVTKLKDSVLIEWNGKVGQVSYIASNASGCIDSVSQKVIIYPKPIVLLTANKSLCLSDSITVVASGSIYNSLNWTSRGVISKLSPIDTISIKYKVSTKDTLKVLARNSYGCLDTNRIIIRVDGLPNPSISLLGSIIKCENDTISLKVNIYTKSSYSLSNKANYYFKGIPNSLVYNKNTIDTVRILEIDSNGCKNQNDIVLNINGRNKPSIMGKDTICLANIESFKNDTTNIGVYSWSAVGGSILSTTKDSISAKYMSGGKYVISIKTTNKGGCTDSNSKSIFVQSLPTQLVSIPSYKCFGDSVKVIDLKPNKINKWILSSNFNLLLGNISSDSLTGTYSKIGADSIGLLSQDKYGCSTKQFYKISTRALPNVNILKHAVVCTPESTYFYSKSSLGIVNQTWTIDKAVLKGIDSININFADTISKNKLSTQVTDSFGCQVVDSVLVNKEATPQVFDKFKDVGLCQGESLDVKIVNKSTNISVNQWYLDGKYYSNKDTLSLPDSAYKHLVYFKLIGKKGCLNKVSDTFTITKNAKPSYFVGIGNTCLGDSASGMVITDPTNKIDWTLGILKVTGKKFNYKRSIPGIDTAYFRITTSKNCVINDRMLLETYSLPTVGFNTNDICADQSLTLLSSNPNGTKYLWSINGKGVANSQNLTSKFNDNDIVTLKITDNHKCSDSISKNIVVHPKPNPKFTMSQFSGNKIKFDAVEQQSSFAHIWRFDQSDSIIGYFPSDSFRFSNYGLHTVKHQIVSIFGCVNTMDSTFEIQFDGSFRHKLYPNPFFEQTNLSFSLQELSKVQIIMYNVRGKLIQTMVDANLPSGDYVIPLNKYYYNGADAYYFIRVLINNRVFVEKAIQAR